jgi:predicted glycoside hydrolase/deacetylase ChbG (UPF0249 family)
MYFHHFHSSGFIFILSMIFLNFPSIAKAQGPKLIVRADDMGSSHSANMAIQKSYTEGFVTSVEVMVVTAWFPEAVKMLKSNPGIDVGLHLTLTSEWENIKWRPLSCSKSLVDSNGYFYPMRSPHPSYPGQSLAEVKLDLNEIEQEFRAQIELVLRNIPQLSHLTDHMGCASVNDSVMNLVKKLAEEYGLVFEPSDLLSFGYGGQSGSFPEKKNAFLKMLTSLETGKSYLFLDHPGLNDAELQAVYHIGYERVAADRQEVTDLFTDPEVKQEIQKLGIKLISYQEFGSGKGK